MKPLSNSIYTADNDEDSLQTQFNRLQIEWDSIKQSIPRSTRRNSLAAGDHRLFQMHENSPKELMSLLQLNTGNSPNSGDRDRAKVEIIEEREADFDNGRLKGRRLFEEFDDVCSDDNNSIVVGTHGTGCFDMGSDDNESIVVGTHGTGCFDVGYDDNDNIVVGTHGSGRFDVGYDDNDSIVVGTQVTRCFDVDEQSEVSTVSTEFFCKGFENYDEKGGRFCTGSSWSDEKDEGVVAVVVKGGGGSRGGRGSVGRLMVFAVVMFAIAIVVLKCSGEYEQILVPT